ncbi:DUF6790 family protein [Methanobacterium sp. ACI-7]|uniref:DUF6790 family protein n=1 Tax=unclassified Methanobacterium TaxID=2627676 RepID=UPI0039C4BC40
MEMTYIFILITLVSAVLHLFLSKTERTKNKVFEVFLLWFLFIMVGIGSIWAFIGHVFMTNTIAAMIGWPAGNPFQLEVGVANLSYGILGILCWKFRDNFWTATVAAVSTFYLGAAYIHITNIAQTGNLSSGNAGYALYIDIIIPIILICLLVACKLTSNNLITTGDSELPKSA